MVVVVTTEAVRRGGGWGRAERQKRLIAWLAGTKKREKQGRREKKVTGWEEAEKKLRPLFVHHIASRLAKKVLFIFYISHIFNFFHVPYYREYRTVSVRTEYSVHRERES